MSTMSQEFGQVIGQRTDDASRAAAVARQARRFFRFVNRMPPTGKAEAVMRRRQAVAHAEQKRYEAYVRHGPRII